MEKSKGTKITVILLVFGLVVYSIYFGQLSFAEVVELKTVGKGVISCGNGEEVKGVRINFFVSHDKGTTFAEWNMDHKELGSAGGMINNVKTSSNSFVLKGFEAFDNICDVETPSDVSLSGNCGEGTVRLVSDNGNKGTFASNVKCG
ncbi:MAG TPA: hypothetical protein VK566_05765 [Nitrososphaeraceae archaeon]|jgi:hypothetical protein|nr:hypothetical protein [Nitrososphaeraceae archaeon]